ncbi:MAG: protein-disulfide isomerase [Sphingobium sp.]|nr:MAG: protein-disulfide isomerase [Sphingobium sp.]
MKPIIGIALAALILPLAACGSKEGGNASAPSGAPVAAVPAPAGTTWADTVDQTPEGGYRMGNPGAPIKVTEFASYTCSHCRDFAAESSEELRALVNSGKVSYELRNYVRDPIDMTMSLLVRCGGKDIFFPMSEQFFSYQEEMFKKVQGAGDAAYQSAMAAPPAQRFEKLAELTGLVEFAKQRGISEGQAKQCLADTAEPEKLAKDVQAATTQYNITGTPTLLINGSVVENVTTWPQMRTKLKEAGA